MNTELVSEKERLLLYTVQSCRSLSNLRTKESKALAKAIMKIAVDRAVRNTGERLSVCGTYTSSVRNSIRKTVTCMYSEEEIGQFIALCTAYADTGEYPDSQEFDLMAEKLLEMVPTLLAKTNPLFR